MRPLSMTFLLCILLISTPASVWTQCTAANVVQQLNINPNPVEYDSGREINANEIGCFQDNPTACIPSVVAIGDGRRQPTSLTDLGSAFAWNEDVTITMGLPADMMGQPSVRVRAVNLFFYNIPLMGIGLPHEIELNWGNTTLINTPNHLGRAVLGNSDLSQDDNTTRNVTIAAIADDSGDETNYRALSITFHFSDASPIRWLILSEVEVCTSSVNVNPRQDLIPLTPQGDEVIQLQSDNIQSQIDLTCNIEVEGSFQWVWSGSGPAAMSTFQQVLTNTNRTSSITLTQLSTEFAGTYTCTATYDPRSLPMGVTSNIIPGSRILTLQFDSAITVALSNSTVNASMNSSVTLSCEVYGYLPRLSLPPITWRRMNGGTIGNSSLYTITTSNGSRQIQNGGPSPIPSHVSSLIIDMMDDSVAGMYTCSGPSNFQAIQLQLLVDSETGTPIPTTDARSPQSEGASISWPIVGGILGALVLISALIPATIIVVVMCARGRHKIVEGTYDLPADYEKPIAPPVGTIPPRMEMNVNISYEQVRSFDMNANSVYTVVANN